MPRLAGPPPQRPPKRPQAPADGPAPIVDVSEPLAGHLGQATGGPGQEPDAGRGESGVGRIADVGLDDRRVDPERPGSEAPLPDGELDDLPGELRDELGPQAPGELADGRLVGHRVAEREQAETPQVERIGDLPDEGRIAPAGPRLDDHQPDIRGHREGRPPGRLGVAARRCVALPPERPERRHEGRVREELVDRREVRREEGDAGRQQGVPDRVTLLIGLEPEHRAPHSSWLADACILLGPSTEGAAVTTSGQPEREPSAELVARYRPSSAGPADIGPSDGPSGARIVRTKSSAESMHIDTMIVRGVA